MDWSSFISVGGPILGLLVALLALIFSLTRRYKLVPQNKAIAVYGWKAEVITSGGKFIWPIVQSYQELDLGLFQVDVTPENIPSKDNVAISMVGVSTCCITSDQSGLKNAARGLMGKNSESVKLFVKNIFEGQLRAVIAKMTVEELIQNREKLNSEIRTGAAAELENVGIDIKLFNIQSITDADGYIKALGMKRTAEVKRDAAIGQAEASRDQQQKVTDAQREGAVKAAENAAMTAEAEKERDVKRQKYAAETAAETARAAQAGPLAEAEAQKAVKMAQQATLAAEQASMVKVEEEKARVAAAREEAAKVVPMKKAADAKEAEADGQRRSMIKQAEGEKQKSILAAEGDKQKNILAAEAAQQAAILKAEGDRQKLEKEGAGEAAKVKALGDGEASRIRAIGEAEAAKVEKVGEAEAKVIKAKLLAEAEGLLKKAEAYAKLDEAGRMQMILEKAPAIITSFASVTGSIAQAMTGIDKVVIIDQGQGSGLSKFAGNVPGVILQLFEVAKAAGVDVAGLLGKVGIKVGPAAEAADMTARLEAAKTVTQAHASDS